MFKKDKIFLCFIALSAFSGCPAYNSHMETLDNNMQKRLSREAVDRIVRRHNNEAVVFTRVSINNNNNSQYKLCRINLKPLNKTDWAGLLTGQHLSYNSIPMLTDSNIFAGAAATGTYKVALYCDPTLTSVIKTAINISTNITVTIPSVQGTYYLGDISFAIKSTGYRTGEIESIDIINNFSITGAEFSNFMQSLDVNTPLMHQQLAINQ